MASGRHLNKDLGVKLSSQFRVSMGFLEEDETDPAVHGTAVATSSSRKNASKLSSMLKSRPLVSQSVQTTNVVESESEDRTNGSVLSLTQSAIIEASSLVDVVSSYEILIFEICCYPNSNLANVAIQAFPYGALIVRCTESSPLEEFQDQTIRTLSAHHRAPNRFSYIHISLPCTGGSSLQNLSDNEALKSEHVEKFFTLLAQCKPLLKLCSLWTFELPK